MKSPQALGFTISISWRVWEIKYLSFYLKPTQHRVADWLWIIDKYRKRNNGWSLRWLSKGGKLILAQAVFQRLLVYWAHLFLIAKAITEIINTTMANFIWEGGRGKGKYHLTELEHITDPKNWGGWGLLDIDSFGKALIMKSIWRCLHTPGVWRDLIRYKYLRSQTLETIYLVGCENDGRGSYIWSGF